MIFDETRDNTTDIEAIIIEADAHADTRDDTPKDEPKLTVHEAVDLYW